MTSDRARVTYDPARRYHGVVAQQGRVSLEADWNEAQAITGAELATRTLDVVGRAGSPDRGYEITPVADGGTRLMTSSSGRARCTSAASGCTSPATSATPTSQTGPTTRATRCGATRPCRGTRTSWSTSWPASRRSARSKTRPCAMSPWAARTPRSGCVSCRALSATRPPPRPGKTRGDSSIEEQWRPRGFTVDEASRALLPGARLQVTAFSADGREQPADHGGYLGPNNQLIRVQVARVDRRRGAGPRLGLRQRLVPVPAVQLGDQRVADRPAAGRCPGRRVPPAQGAPGRRGAAQRRAPVRRRRRGRRRHRPGRPGRRRVQPGQQGSSGRHGAPTGVPEEAGGRPAALPAGMGRRGPVHSGGGARAGRYRPACPADRSRRLPALRPRPLDPAPEAAFPEAYPVGAYWTIAVRPGVGPGAEGVVYPQRILDRPQPPDGPRQWLTPLAFIRWRPGAAPDGGLRSPLRRTPPHRPVSRAGGDPAPAPRSRRRLGTPGRDQRPREPRPRGHHRPRARGVRAAAPVADRP